VSLARGHRFPRALRLKRRRLIRPLFAREAEGVGRVSVGVVQLRWRLVPRAHTGTGAPLQAGFAPGRRARTHVGRNRLRRRMREVWRVHHAPLLARMAARPDATLAVFVVFRGREETAGTELPRDLPAAIGRLAARLADVSPGPVPTPREDGAPEQPPPAPSVAPPR
jgi:ribonuclease P protein component